jgi:alpha-1,2-mannosyltransferase
MVRGGSEVAPERDTFRVATVRGTILLVILAAPLLIFQVGSADLDVYRAGGSALLHGGSLYAPGFAAHLRSRLPFTYPPFAAVAALVLVPLPSGLATYLWAGVTVIMLVWCVRVSFRPWLERNPLRADLTVAGLTAVALCTRPVFDHLGDGQVDILLMTLCLADTVTVNPRWPRGLLVGLATAIKLVPGIFIPYLWLTGRRGAAALAAGTFVACEALSGLITYSDSRRYWTRLVFETERPGQGAVFKNQSLRGIGLRLLPAAGRTWVLIAVALVIVVVGLIRARLASSRGALVAGATLAGLAGVLASPVSWIHATVWIIPAIGILLDRGMSPRRVLSAIAILAALVAGLPYLPNVVPGLPRPIVQLLWASFGLICAGLVVVLPTSSPAGAGAESPPSVAP